MSWEYLEILGQKVQRKKIGKNHKDFKLYQVFMFNFLNENIGIFVLYIYCLQEDSTHFGVRVLIQFCLEALQHFVSKKSWRKNEKKPNKF